MHLSRDAHILHVVVHVIDMKCTMDVTFSGILSLCLRLVACACIIMLTHTHTLVIWKWRVTLQRVTVFGAVVTRSNGQVGESVLQCIGPCSHSFYPISHPLTNTHKLLSLYMHCTYSGTPQDTPEMRKHLSKKDTFNNENQPLKRNTSLKANNMYKSCFKVGEQLPKYWYDGLRWRVEEYGQNFFCQLCFVRRCTGVPMFQRSLPHFLHKGQWPTAVLPVHQD